MEVLEQDTAPHKRRRGKHRKYPWKIERRYIGKDVTGLTAKIFSRDWELCGAYETERGRDDAFRTASMKGGFNADFEYRKPI